MSLLNDRILQVIQWGNDRNLIAGGCPKAQMLKCVAEVGELADNVNKQADIKDDVGDVLVTLILVAAQHKTSLLECLDKAYETIKDRKGITLDGVYIKESDPHYSQACQVVAARKVV